MEIVSFMYYFSIYNFEQIAAVFQSVSYTSNVSLRVFSPGKAAFHVLSQFNFVHALWKDLTAKFSEETFTIKVMSFQMFLQHP